MRHKPQYRTKNTGETLTWGKNRTRGIGRRRRVAASSGRRPSARAGGRCGCASSRAGAPTRRRRSAVPPDRPGWPTSPFVGRYGRWPWWWRRASGPATAAGWCSRAAPFPSATPLIDGRSHSPLGAGSHNPVHVQRQSQGHSRKNSINRQWIVRPSASPVSELNLFLDSSSLQQWSVVVKKNELWFFKFMLKVFGCNRYVYLVTIKYTFSLTFNCDHLILSGARLQLRL